MNLRWMLIPCLLVSLGSAQAGVTEDDEALDKLLGLLEEPFKLDLMRAGSRERLRKASGVGTGLPSYDQQVETAQAAPASLLTPTAVSTPATRSRSSGSSSAAAPAAASSSSSAANNNGNNQGGQNQNCNFSVFPPVCN